MRFRRVRNYNKYFTRRGGYTPVFMPGAPNQSPQVFNDPTFRTVDITPTRRTGGRTGRHSWPDNSPGRIGRQRDKYNKTDKDKVKDGPVIFGPMPGGGSNYEKPFNMPVTINFGINRQRVRPTAAGSTYSYSTLFSPRRISKTKQARALNRNVPTQSCEYIKTNRCESGCGQQTTFPYSWLTATTYDNFCANTAAASTFGAKTAEVWHRRSVLTMTMTNNTNGNIFCEIWEGYYRRDCKDDVVSLWRQGLLDQGIQGPTGIAAAPDCNYMMDPLKSRLFCQHCRVTNVTHLELGCGRGHQHRSRLYANIKYNNEIYQEINTNVNNLAGLTRFIMVIARGGPVNQSGVRSTISTGQIGLDIIVTTKHSYFYNTPQTSVMYTSGNSFPTLSTPTVVNEDTGSPVVNEQW